MRTIYARLIGLFVVLCIGISYGGNNNGYNSADTQLVDIDEPASGSTVSGFCFNISGTADALVTQVTIEVTCFGTYGVWTFTDSVTPNGGLWTDTFFPPETTFGI